MALFPSFRPSLRARLVLLTVLAAAPALALVAGHAVSFRDDALAMDRLRAEHALAQAADAEAQLIARATRQVQALARRPDVSLGTPDACAARLGAVLDGEPAYNNVTRATPDGRVDCSALPLAKPLILRDVPSFQRAIARRQFSIGDYQRSQATGRAVVVLAQPVVVDDRIQAVLAVSVRLDWLDTLAAAAVPFGGTLVTFDESGTTLGGRTAARVPDAVRNAAQRNGVGRTQVLEVSNQDREPSLWAVRTLGRAGAGAIHAAVQVPVAVAYAGARQTTIRDSLAVLVALVLLVGIALASVTRLISEPLDALSAATERLSSGDLDARAPVGTGTPELQAFAMAFNQMADTVQERDRQLTALAERSPDGIARLGLDGRLLYANPALGRLLGMPAGALVGRPLADVLPQALQETLEALGVLADGRSSGDDIVEGDVVLPSGSGTLVVDVRLVPERDEHGAPVARLAVLRDVTAARQTADALRQAQKLDSIGHLAGGIAHDFNNLLTGIVGHADMALEDLAADAPARHDVQALRDAAMRSTGMTRQLLTFARTQPPTLTPSALGAVVKDVSTLLERLLGAGIALSLELDDDVPMADMDRGQIEQVLVNLAVNARDAMPSGGTLTIRTRAADVDASKAARIGVRSLGRYAVLEVEDTGTGMPPAVMQRIFEPFFSTKAPGKGTGLGLSTCYAIARDHGGVLTVSSHPGMGTRFLCYLPASTRTAAGPEAMADTWRDVVAGGTERVLLVEDDAGLRTLLARVLRSRGYTVDEAADGAQGLALATGPGASRYGLVVSDLRTPRLGGATLARQLRRAEPSLPVLFVTGHPDDLDPDGTLDGAPVLAKPFTAVQLLHAVRERLDGAARA